MMKLPLYLKIALLATLGLTVLSQFSKDVEQDEMPHTLPKTSLISKQEHSSTKASTELPEEKIDLFPIYDVSPSETDLANKAAKNVQRSEILPPFTPVGIWLSEGRRTVVLSDGQRSWLLCAICHSPDYVRPGGELIKQWKLIELKEDYLVVEWIPEHVRRRIELGNLKLE